MHLPSLFFFLSLFTIFTPCFLSLPPPPFFPTFFFFPFSFICFSVFLFFFLYSCFPPSTFLQSLGAFLIYLLFHIFIIQSTSSYYLTLFLFLLLLLLPFPPFYFPTNSSFFLLNSFSIFLILPHSLSVFFLSFHYPTSFSPSVAYVAYYRLLSI